MIEQEAHKMKRERLTTRGLLLVLTVLALLGLAGPVATPSVLAETPVDATGPDDTVAPTGEWQPLGAGESHWYAFQYQGDSSQIQVHLEVVPHRCATFDVWTPDQIRRWGQGEYVEPVGRGSQDPYAEGHLVWSGSFTTAGTYYVAVQGAGSPSSLSFYLLEIDGQGVSFPESAGTAVPTPTAQPATSRPEPAASTEPSGKLVFQTTYGGTFYTINVDGTNLQRITDGTDPTWSPSGEQIAFTRWREPRGVWVANADGSDEQRVFDWNEARWPSWSPEGDQILFSRQHGGQEERERCFRGWCFTIPAQPYWKLGVVNVDDRSFSEPPSADVSQAPAWSPEGERFVYNDGRGLVVQSMDGETSHEITHHANDTSPVWSPNGDQVAFVRRQHDHWEVYVVDADGQNPRRLTATPERPDGVPGNSVSPAWSPDGDYLAFLTDRTGEWEIWGMTATGSGQESIFDTELDGLRLDYAFVGDRAISWTR
jgi:hypothetical protein